MNYYYPLVVGGYRWNILMRCLHEVGIEPSGISDMNDQTVIQFSRALTTTEKAALDVLMNSNPSYPPTTGVGVTVIDIWEDFDGFKAACNLPNLKLYYTESVVGSGKIDRLYLWHPTSLTNGQRNALKTAYTNLFQS
jgi:hypothetical protein